MAICIIYFEGFRHDYLNQYNLPTLNRFRNEGVQATDGMRPTFTTMTFPNHISIATGQQKKTHMNDSILSFVCNLGMYQEDHGVVHNEFYDRLLNRTIGMSLYLNS